MARRIRNAALVLALLPTFLPGQDAAKPGRVDGSVVNGITGEPLAHARVKLLAAGYQGPDERAEGYGVITGDDGNFSWDSIRPGTYEIAAEMRGFIESDNHGNLEIKPDSAIHDVKLKLVPEGNLTGRVLDSHGDAVEGVKVWLMIGVGHFMNATTDDRGQFRFTGLPAFKYLVRAEPDQVSGPPEIRTDGTKEECHAPTWFPNALAKSEATPVEVTAGAQISGIEIRLVRMPIVRVSGAVTGAVPRGLMVAAYTDDGSNRGESAVRNGKFEIWRLPPGKYQLSAGGFAPAGAESVELRSYPVSVDLAQSNIDNLTLDVVPEFEVAGRVEWDGTPPPSDRLKDAAINLRFQYIGQVAADGSFRIPHVTVGKLRVQPMGMPDSVFVKSVRLGPDEMPGADLDLRNDPKEARVTVVLSAAGAEISGVVRRGNTLAANALVCAAPDRENSGCERWPQTGADGSFTIHGLAPGRYKLYVTDIGSGQPGPNPVEVIEVHESEKATRDLTVADHVQ